MPLPEQLAGACSTMGDVLNDELWCRHSQVCGNDAAVDKVQDEQAADDLWQELDRAAGIE